MMVNGYISLSPATGQPVWYRATVSGSSSVSGSLLLNTVWITASDYFEVSFSSDKDYAPSIALSQRNGDAVETPVYVRLKSDLAVNAYEGDILITSNGSVSKGLSLSGSVMQESLVNDIPDSPVTVISTWYYTITGHKVSDIEDFTGIFIVRKLLSDGTVSSYKILKK
jgi:hypothetical protein